MAATRTWVCVHADHPLSHLREQCRGWHAHLIAYWYRAGENLPSVPASPRACCSAHAAYLCKSAKCWCGHAKCFVAVFHINAIGARITTAHSHVELGLNTWHPPASVGLGNIPAALHKDCLEWVKCNAIIGACRAGAERSPQLLDCWATASFELAELTTGSAAHHVCWGAHCCCSASVVAPANQCPECVIERG
jgi:hypothetical protein